MSREQYSQSMPFYKAYSILKNASDWLEADATRVKSVLCVMYWLLCFEKAKYRAEWKVLCLATDRGGRGVSDGRKIRGRAV